MRIINSTNRFGGAMALSGLAAALTVLAVLAVMKPARAGQAPAGSMVLILDASGSMWGKVGDKTKIEVAKQSLSKIIEELPDSSRVGLIAYGHRSKGDCADVEELAKVGPVDKKLLTQKIMDISPRGMTPITASLERAVESIRSEEGKSSVILFSDGKETCEGDPCAAAKKLMESGVSFTINVIGFDVSDQERRQLECIAEAGGGKYYPAGSAQDFFFAAQEVTRASKAQAPATGEGKLVIEGPAETISGGYIKVRFEAASTFHSNAWVGVVPSDIPHGDESVNDRHDTTYEYLHKRTSGTMTLAAPGKPGTYDIRMHDSDDGGREVASVTFTVKPAGGSLELGKSEYMAGEEMRITFTASPGMSEKAWAGLIPASVPHGNESENDQHDVYYEYLKGRTQGTLVWKAPGQPGKWDVRLHDTDDNGTEIASVSFRVIQATGSIKLDKQTYSPGGQIKVSFSTSAPLAENAWIGIIPSAVPHGKESDGDSNDLSYQYINGMTNGALTFQAPEAPGAYDIRMYDTDDDGSELDSQSFSVE